MLIGLDFETYSDVDLTVHGLDRYVSSPNFLPLIAHVHFVDDTGTKFASYRFWQEGTRKQETAMLANLLRGNVLVAHNAGFELAVLKWLGIGHPLSDVRDSAVVARAAGASGKLAYAAPQLLGADKMAEGFNLIRLFSIPGKYQEENGDGAFDLQIIRDHPDEWDTFNEYCALDAKLGHNIYKHYHHVLPEKEWVYQAITMEMNQVGWPVDLAAVNEMQRRFLDNVEYELQLFRDQCDAEDLNLNSMQQMKAWCAKRGIKANSFDVENVSKLLKRITSKVDSMAGDDPKRPGYIDVMRLLQTKQVLGGSSLKKLEVILNSTGHDGRLRDQYMHIGAGQTWRTSGRGAQLQNLPRFNGEPADMSTLFDPFSEWSNDELSENIRQVFTSSHSQGQLIVGDFSSVESRGLAWAADETWKLDAYAKGRDVYKELAARNYSISYEAVTKPQRQFGKVGELSCGYQAAGGAVQSFAAGMGVELSEGEAAKLVSDWREADPKTVEFWAKLDAMLHAIVEGTKATDAIPLNDGYTLIVRRCSTPESLRDQAVMPVTSVEVMVVAPSSGVFLTRRFLGCHMRGRNIGYFKPLERKSGPLWDNMRMNPKTKQREFITIYGGKLTGILTQSFCREVFFETLREIAKWAQSLENVAIIGQFHDEIVIDGVPPTGKGQSVSLEQARHIIEMYMSDSRDRSKFPMAAEVKSDYRYTK